ncbi:MAG: PilZ domain-containing protein [Litorimonas sp.]
MSARRIILGCFLGLISAQIARAETACGTLSHMIESVSLVRQIQTDPGGPAYNAQIARLSIVTAQISLPDIIPADPAASRPTERDALIRYVSGLREAVSGAASGHDIYARQTLETIITPAVFGGLTSLESHWNCGGEENAKPSYRDSDIDTEAFSGADGGDAENSFKRLSNPTDSAPVTPDRQTLGSRNGTTSGRDAVVTGNVMTFFIMLLIIGLIAVFFYAQSQARQKTVREARRALNVLIDVELDGISLQMRLVDISMNGFKIRHSGQINDQENITIAIGDAWHQGHIRWANPHYAGVKFKRAIDPETLASVMKPIV